MNIPCSLNFIHNQDLILIVSTTCSEFGLRFFFFLKQWCSYVSKQTTELWTIWFSTPLPKNRFEWNQVSKEMIFNCSWTNNFHSPPLHATHPYCRWKLATEEHVFCLSSSKWQNGQDDEFDCGKIFRRCKFGIVGIMFISAFERKKRSWMELSCTKMY